MLTRREFLGAAGALAVTPRWLGTEGSFSFAFFSDTHVSLKNNLEENRAMLREMGQTPIAFAINGGDVTEAGWAGEYDNWRGLLADAPFKVRHIPGNHDVRWSPLGPKAYERGTGDPMYQWFEHQGVAFALLDSTVPLSHWGHYESEMLRWLEKKLKGMPRDTPLFVATHHWVGREGVMIDNEGRLLDLLEPYNLKILLTGHGHSNLLWTINGMSATMNKGLYQGSWQRVDVDREKREVRLTRTAGPAKDPSRRKTDLLLTLPLAPPREKRRTWQVGSSGLRPEEFTEGRWDDGKFVDIVEALAAEKTLVGGSHRLVLRRPGQIYLDAGETLAKGSSGVLKQKWHRTLTGGIMSHLVLAGDGLYISAMDGSLAKLNPNTSDVLWRATTRGYCHSSPHVAGDLVVVGSADGNVYAFNRLTGKEVWHAPTEGPVYASASSAKGIICIASGDGSVRGLRTLDGKQVWRYDLPPSNTAFVQSPIATDGERFFLGAWDKNLYALEAATGKFLWKHDCVGERSWAYSPAIGGPVVTRGRVIVPANGNNLVCCDAATGEQIWIVSSPGDKFGYSSPVLAGERLFIGCLGDNGEACCVSVADGSVLWTAKTGSVIYDSGPAYVSGRDMVIVGSVSGLVSACDGATGAIRGQYRLPTGHLLSTPAASQDAVFVGSYSDTVTRFDIV